MGTTVELGAEETAHLEAAFAEDNTLERLRRVPLDIYLEARAALAVSLFRRERSVAALVEAAFVLSAAPAASEAMLVVCAEILFSAEVISPESALKFVGELQPFSKQPGGVFARMHPKDAARFS